MKREPRILPGKPVDDGRQETCHHGFRTADAQFTHCGISQRLQLVHAAAQIVAESNAALEQGVAVEGGLDADATALQQRNAERLLQGCDHLRDDRL